MTQTHTRWNSFGRMISPSQILLPDNTQNSQYIHVPLGFEPAILASKRPQTHALGLAAATEIACSSLSIHYYSSHGCIKYLAVLIDSEIIFVMSIELYLDLLNFGWSNLQCNSVFSSLVCVFAFSFILVRRN